MNPAGNLAYDVFVNDPPPQDGFLTRPADVAMALDSARRMV